MQTDLSQLEAEALLRMEKSRMDNTSHPFPELDRHNDYIQIYLRQNGDEWELTDDGETLADLVQSGCELDTPRRKTLLHTTLNGSGMNSEIDCGGVRGECSGKLKSRILFPLNPCVV